MEMVVADFRYSVLWLTEIPELRGQEAITKSTNYHGGCMSNEYEYTLETALDKLEDSLLSSQEIDVIRLACGKPRNEQVNPLLRDVINDFGNCFGNPLASFPTIWRKNEN